MTDDFCRAVRNALPDIAQSVVTAMEDELADCRARLAEVERERDAWRKAALEGDRPPRTGRTRAALAQTKESEHD